MPNIGGPLLQFGEATLLGRHRHNATRKGLLIAGFRSSLLYVVATDVVAASTWDGYSRPEQMVSEHFAAGSPGRPVLLPVTWLCEGPAVS